MNDDTTLKIAILILATTTVGLFIGLLNKDYITNNQICKRLYTNTTDYLKCTTNDVTHTISLIQPLKEVEE